MNALILLGMLLFLRPFPASAEPPDALAKETRFARSVRVEAEGISISELLARVSEVTGLPLRASREVAEEKVIVFGPARSLREILQDIAALLGAEWQERSEKDASPYYLLEKRPAARKRETTLADSVIDQMFQKMEEQIRALRESPQEFARRPEHDSIRHFLSQPDGKARQATEFYASLNRRQRWEIFERGQVRSFYANLPPAWQAMSQRELTAWRKASEERKDEIIFSTALMAVSKPRETPPDLEIKFDWRNYGVASLEFHPGFVVFAILRAELPRLPRHGNPFTGEPLPTDAALPVVPLIETADADVKADWIARLRRLSETANVPIVADYYRLRCAPDAIPPGKTPTKPATDALAALDAFSQREDCLWWIRGRTLLFRKTDWYERRLYEPSDHWLTDITRSIAERDGWSTYADVLRLKDLTQRQIIGLAALNEDRRGWLPYALSTPTEKLAGISELLNILRVRVVPTGRSNSPVLLQDSSAANYGQALEQSTLRYTDLTSYQQQLLFPFLAAQRQSLQEGPQEGIFSCWITAYPPEQGDRGYRYQRVTIHWRAAGRTRDDYEISLPLTLPDDRRDRTKITAM
jgi:hypothetical protein